ncbi:antitoxin [Pantoea sp. RIT-PI-b]|nr:antitoxin [Pantoea sp. RIT-PI-b]
MYTEALANLSGILELANKGESVEITLQNGGSVNVVSKASYEEYRKILLNAEFAELMGEFDESNKALSQC